jgi:hypothetical protein
LWASLSGSGCGGEFVLDWGPVAERLVQAIVVVPADVFDDRLLELRLGAPHAIGDQLGLEGVDEALGECVDAPIVKDGLARSVGRL